MNGRPARRRSLVALAVALTALHLWLADVVLEAPLSLGPGASPRPIEVSFVSELVPAPPAVRAVVPPPAVRANVPSRAAPAAQEVPQAPEVAQAASSPAPDPPEALARTPQPVDTALAVSQPAPASPPAPALASAPASAAGLAAGPAPGPPPEPAAVAAGPAASASAAAFDWPPSTRMSYTLTGEHRGPVEGQARVEWRRDGDRYQVEVTVEIGPFFAPLMSRTAISDGRITPQGLHPRRYVEETRIAFSTPRRFEMRFDDAAVVLGNGRRVPRPDGLQDSASQFVHMTWLFTLQPERLAVGEVIELPLALPHRVDAWRYEVVGEERLHTPFGPVDAFHVRPRREPRPGVEMTAEMWVAPTLQYLPARIVIRQDAQTWIDLLVEKLPMQAAPGR